MSENVFQTERKVLFIDDDEDVLAAASLLLSRHGMAMTGVTTLEEGGRVLTDQKFDLLLLDLNFRRGDSTGAAGLEFLQALTSRLTAPPVVVVTGHSGLSIAVRAVRMGAVDFIMKPWNNGRLITALKDAADRPPTPRPMIESTDLNLERSEKTLIALALNRHAHNISLAAKDLGITRAALYRRMEKHGF